MAGVYECGKDRVSQNKAWVQQKDMDMWVVFNYPRLTKMNLLMSKSSNKPGIVSKN